MSSRDTLRMVPGSTSRLLVLVVALAAMLVGGCGGGGDDGEERAGRRNHRGPTPEELADYQAAEKEIRAWEDETRSMGGSLDTARKDLVKDLRAELTATIRQDPDRLGQSPRAKALKEELFAFSKDDRAVPTNPITLDAARAYAEARLVLEQDSLDKFRDLAARRPEPHPNRPISTHADRYVAEGIASAEAGVAIQVEALERLAVVDANAAWPPTAVAANDTLPPTSTTVTVPPIDPSTPTPEPPPTTVVQADSTPKPTVPPTLDPTEPLPSNPPPPKKTFLGPPPVAWSVGVDPAPQPSEPLPALANYQLTGDPNNFFFAPGSNRVVAFGQGKGSIKAAAVHDLRTGQPLGTVTGFSIDLERTRTTGPALSPDGAFLAIYSSLKETIVVGDVAKNAPAALLSVSDEKPSMIFPTPNRLLAVDRKGTTRLWELPAGNLLRTFSVVEDVSERVGTRSCSPGGRFLAVAHDSDPPKQIAFYDLETGREAGRLLDHGERTSSVVYGMAFSPDGTEFAAFIGGSNQAISVWDVATGRLVYGKRLVNPSGGQVAWAGTEQLQWFPDGQGWLLSQRVVVDRETCHVVDEHLGGGSSFAQSATHVLDDTHVLEETSTSRLAPVDVVRSKK